MALAVLKYFAIESHLLAVLTVQHPLDAEVILTGCTPLRATTLALPGQERQHDQATIYECSLDLRTCDQLLVYVNARLVSIFHLGRFVSAEPGPDSLNDAGRARMVPWL